MNPMVAAQLLQFEKLLFDLKIKSLDYLKPGITGDLIGSEIGEIYPLIGSNVIINDLYSWHNGTITNYTQGTETFKITPRFFFNSINSIKEIVGGADSVLEFKLRNQIPLFSTGHGEYLSVNVSQLSSDPQNAGLFYVSTWNPEFEFYTLMFDNVFTFLETTIECLENGAYYKNEDGVLELDFDKEYEIATRLNKKATYWRD
ncbi:MAG: hypothetical protein M3R17_04075 [Bacteroidota bacterium]|nr:hypothetical protein [Bacteroidota bacterium]